MNVSIKEATWRRPLVTARLDANGADNGFQLQMSQLEATLPSVMQTNGQPPPVRDICLEYAEMCRGRGLESQVAGHRQAKKLLGKH